MKNQHNINSQVGQPVSGVGALLAGGESLLPCPDLIDNIKYISLTQGKFAIVDAEDFDFLNQWKWSAQNSRGILYALRRVYYRDEYNKQKYYYIHMHRLIINCPNGMVVDHINHNSLDNRKENLRICTHRENLQNQRKTNKCGYIGIFKNKKKYIAHVGLNGKRIWSKSFDTPKDAHDAYIELSNKIKLLDR